MKNSTGTDSRARIKLTCRVLALVWTLSVGGSLYWTWGHLGESVRALALASARLSFDKDLVYRQWAAQHGGVYVPVTEETPPNPYLSHVPERDIFTPSGRALTLVNPAYMTRQVHELGHEDYGLQGHITSLTPLRPANKPDSWEAKALRAFEEGAPEVVAEETLNGESYLRLMRPMVTEEACLKCHARQGYEVGDIRGGISISAPMGPYLRHMEAERRKTVLGHGLVWGLGLLGLILALSRLRLAQGREDAVRARMMRDKLRLLSASRRQQHLRSIGTMASGMAHEINNPLNVMLNYSQLVLDEENCPPVVKDYARQIGTEGERIATIVKALIDFSQPDQQTAHPTNFESLIAEVRILVAGILDANAISLEASSAANLPTVKCSGQQIRQALLNLLSNAVDALNERHGANEGVKKITVTLAPLNEGGQEWVRCTVADNGNGIPPSIADRVFEPFFSSKPKHLGAGLGLSTSYGIVTDHGGRLWFESEPGEGTRFHIDLPIT
jgi:signal transduction histidine kinase